MDSPDAILRAILRHRDRLNQQGRRTVSDLLNVYGHAYRDLNAQAVALGKLIDEARTQGVTVSAAWLEREARYRQLLQSMTVQIDRFTSHAYQTTVTLVQDAVDAATADTAAVLTGFDIAPADHNGTSTVRKLLRNHVDNLAATTTRQAPVGQLFARIAPAVAEETRLYLLTETAKGTAGKTIAKGVAQRLQIPAQRATTIVRTEQMRAYRETARAQYEDAGIDTWQWLSGQSARTCPVCWAKHGTLYHTSQRMPTHPNCRCTLIPYVEGGPTIETGDTLFANLPNVVQRAILGPAKHRAYLDGMPLSALVDEHTHPTWGPSIRERSLSQAVGPAKAADYFRNK